MAEGGGGGSFPELLAESEKTEADSALQPNTSQSPDSTTNKVVDTEFQDVNLEDRSSNSSECVGENAGLQDGQCCDDDDDADDTPNNTSGDTVDRTEDPRHDEESPESGLITIGESEAVEAEQDNCAHSLVVPPGEDHAHQPELSGPSQDRKGGGSDLGSPPEEELPSSDGCEGSGSGQSSPEGQGLMFAGVSGAVVTETSPEDGSSEQETNQSLAEEDQTGHLEGSVDAELVGQTPSSKLKQNGESEDSRNAVPEDLNLPAQAVETLNQPGASILVESKEATIDAVESDIAEPYEPECDLVCEGKGQGSGHSPSDHTEHGNNPSLLLAVPSAVDPAVSRGLEGGEHNKKEASPTREALGQIQQGIESTISETLGFLDSDPPSAEGSSTPSPTHTTPANSEHLLTHAAFPKDSPSNSKHSITQVVTQNTESRLTVGGGDADSHGDVPEDELLSQLDAELEAPSTSSPEMFVPVDVPNGVRRLSLSEIPEHKELKTKHEELQKEVVRLYEQITKLKSVHEAQDNVLLATQQECDTYRQKVAAFQKSSVEEIYVGQITALEMTIAGQQREIKAGHEKLVTHDEAAKRAVGKLHNELKTRVEQLTAMFEGCRKEKEDMVLKYAKAEQKNIEMESRMSKNDARMREIAKEREVFMGKFKVLKTDQQKCRELFESRSVEVVACRRELERQKELVASLEVKNKWAQNKLKTELEAHKDTKARHEELARKWRSTKEEAEQIRRDCQAMIRTFQEAGDIKSSTLDLELKQKETQLLQQMQEKSDQMEGTVFSVHHMVRRELETLKMKHKEMMEELKTWRDKVKCLEAERIIQELNLDKYRETLQKQKETNSTINKRLIELETIEQDVKDVHMKNDSLEQMNNELEQECAELGQDMERCGSRESEHLDFTQKISDKNAHLQSENGALHMKVKGLTAEQERLSSRFEELKKKSDKLTAALTEEQRLRREETTQLNSKLEEKTKAVEELTIQVDDERNEIRTLKRKHAANIKDVTRQLQAAKRRMDTLEPKERTPSMGSRTSSNGSLDTVNNHKSDQSGQKPPSTPQTPQEETPPFVEVIEIDKQMLVEKIVRLQKAHARKNEKLEFLEDHIQQLFVEVQKKSKIIQSYALREEAGTITPESVDRNKMVLAKKGGIMASLYTSHQQDGAMTLDLSLDISRKLQAVLEDTLLKNITLKENLDTLGEEIARLSQENRRLQLQMQEQHT